MRQNDEKYLISPLALQEAIRLAKLANLAAEEGAFGPRFAPTPEERKKQKEWGKHD